MKLVYISDNEVIIDRNELKNLILERDHYKVALEKERARAVERILAADKDV